MRSALTASAAASGFTRDRLAIHQTPPPNNTAAWRTDQQITALAIRTPMRAANADLIRQHWPGPQPPPKSLLRHAKGRTRPSTVTASAPV